MARSIAVVVVLSSFVVGCSTPPGKGANNGGSNNGASNNGASNNGASNNGASNNGASNNGGATTISASDYDQSCFTNDGCVPVADGDVCEHCGCTSAAVSTASAEQFRSDTAALRASCEPSDHCQLIDCQQGIAACVEGSCIARAPVHLSAASYDRMCETAADCVAIAEGDPCSPCACADAAISVTGEFAYKEDVDAETCGEYGDVLCEPCAIGELLCNAGTCELSDP